MLNDNYILDFADINDIGPWMKMVRKVKDNFPGLDTDVEVAEYRKTVIKNMKRKTALCVKFKDEIVGLMLFSYNSKCLSCMAVHPDHRRRGISSAMIDKMLLLMPADMDISVTTYREGDSKGIAARALYKKYGFIEDELVTEFGYPNQRFILKRQQVNTL